MVHVFYYSEGMDTPTPGRDIQRPDSSVADAFAALDHAHQQMLAAEVGELMALVAIADHYRLDAVADIGAGLERLVSYGHDGTPLIGEFLALEIGPLLGVSPAAAISRIGQALDLRHRLPRLWETTLSGRIRVFRAMQAVRLTSELTAAAAREVDEKLAEALPHQPWTRVMRSLPGWIAAADPVAAAEREERARGAQYVRVSKITDGRVNLWGQVDAEVGIAFDQLLDQIANTFPVTGDDRAADRDRRRAAALGVLARQGFGTDSLPSHSLVVHLNTADPGVAEVEGWGALLSQTLPRFLAGSRVVVRPIVDPTAIRPADSYQVPAEMRFALEQRNPVDVFPFATRPARRCDIDHTAPFQPGEPGQTRLDNLGPLSRYTHRAKTHGGWRLEQPAPGVYEWTSPMGYRYLVTADGSVRLAAPSVALLAHGDPELVG